jgi:hypothetical protein
MQSRSPLYPSDRTQGPVILPEWKKPAAASPFVVRFGIFSASAYKTHNPGHHITSGLVHRAISSTCGLKIRAPLSVSAPQS